MPRGAGRAARGAERAGRGSRGGRGYAAFMTDSAGVRARGAGAIGRAAAIGVLHLAGFAATSALLVRAARRLPGFAASGLAERLARAAAAEPAGGGGIGAWIQLLLREAIVPAAAEELLFRGLVFAGLRRAAGPRTAILGSALLFGAAHGDLHHGLVAALLGIALGCLRERHGLAFALTAHALNNALAFAAPAGIALFGQEAAGGLALGLLLAGSSNAVLLQALRRPGRGDLRGAPAASGDASG